jgi:enhancing lycopene biosynthesis protein 2
MDIETHVNGIVEQIIADITVKVQAQVATVITQKVDEALSVIDYSSILSDKLSQRLDEKLSRLPIDATSIQIELGKRVTALADNLSAQVQQQSSNLIADTVSKEVKSIDFNSTFQATVLEAIQNQQVAFPEQSIPHTSIDFAGFKTSGDILTGGIITKFGSTGIDDQASACQLTIMDEVTVVENNLLTKDLTVKGTTTIEGDLNVTGTVPESSPLFQNVVAAATNNVATNQSLLTSFAGKVVQQIKSDGLDLTKILVNGQVAIDGSNLGPSITYSNLQRLGILSELRVSGETSLGQTLYASGKRVGINTVQPAHALAVWDQEIEIGFGKQENNTGIIEIPRNQTLIISTNNKNNLVLTPDGAATVNKINMGSMSFSVADMPPTSNQPKGSVVFNSNPSLGGPLGWVSLGNATWANFGVID